MLLLQHQAMDALRLAQSEVLVPSDDALLGLIRLATKAKTSTLRQRLKTPSGGSAKSVQKLITHPELVVAIDLHCFATAACCGCETRRKRSIVTRLNLSWDSPEFLISTTGSLAGGRFTCWRTGLYFEPPPACFPESIRRNYLARHTDLPRTAHRWEVRSKHVR